MNTGDQGKKSYTLTITGDEVIQELTRGGCAKPKDLATEMRSRVWTLKMDLSWWEL